MNAAAAVVEVTATLYRYAAAVDARDPGRIAALLSADVQLTRGVETVEGIDAFLEAYRPFLESDALGSRHVVTNVVVDNRGTGVRALANFEATMFTSTGTRQVIGRYEDDLVTRDGTWIFVHKRNIVEWAIDLPPATQL